MPTCLKTLSGPKIYFHIAKSPCAVVNRADLLNCDFFDLIRLSGCFPGRNRDPKRTTVIQIMSVLLFGSDLRYRRCLYVGYIRPRVCFRLEKRGYCAALCMWSDCIVCSQLSHATTQRFHGEWTPQSGHRDRAAQFCLFFRYHAKEGEVCLPDGQRVQRSNPYLPLGLSQPCFCTAQGCDSMQLL